MSRLVRVAYIVALLPIAAAAQQTAPTPLKIFAVEQGLTPAVVLRVHQPRAARSKRKCVG